MDMYWVTSRAVWGAYVFAESRNKARYWLIRLGYIDREYYYDIDAYKLLSDLPRIEAGEIQDSDAYSPHYQRCLLLENPVINWPVEPANYPDEEI